MDQYMTDGAIKMEIAIVDDEAVIRDTVGEFLGRKGHRVRLFADAAVAVAEFRRNPPDLVLLDVRMPEVDGLVLLANLRQEHPDLQVIMITGHGTMDMAIEAMHHGATDFLRKPIRFGDLLAALERSRRLMLAERDRDRLRATLARAQSSAGMDPQSSFITTSAACREIREFIAAAATTPFDSILLCGETGTGKDVLARELHRRLHGLEAPFVVVNCPALPDTLVEGELFGHMRGAYTGADTDRPGAFELADGGTLFLDELGDLAKGAQAKLLRTLESRQVRRLGGHKDLAVEVTVIAATNQDLPTMVEQGAFRRDLLYRLNTFQLTIPPLRERPEDIPLLAAHALTKISARRRRTDLQFTAAALAALQSYDFPGNVRELRNLVERAAMLSADGRIDVGNLTLPPAASQKAKVRGLHPPKAKSLISDGANGSSTAEAQATQEALVQHKWNRRTTAKALGITYEALRWRIDKFQLDG